MNGWEEVYIVKCGEFCKIGRSRDTIQRWGRWYEMMIGEEFWMTDCPYPYTFIARWTVQDSREVESVLHRFYLQYLHHGEWFRLPEFEIGYLRSLEDISSFIREIREDSPRRRSSRDPEKKGRFYVCSCGVIEKYDSFRIQAIRARKQVPRCQICSEILERIQIFR